MQETEDRDASISNSMKKLSSSQTNKQIWHEDFGGGMYTCAKNSNTQLI